MRYYFAPLEGLTDSAFRRIHHKYFPGEDRRTPSLRCEILFWGVTKIYIP